MLTFYLRQAIWNRLALLIAFGVLTSFSASGFADEVKPLFELSGKVENEVLLFKSPPSGIVQDQKTWEALCKQWRPDKPVKKVDFQNQIVLVETAVGPNNIFVSGLSLKDKGALRYELSKSQEPGSGFSYLMLVVSRAKIASVNGRPLPKKPVSLKPTSPANSANPKNTPNTATVPMAPIAPKSDVPRIVPIAAPKGSIKVEIDGQIRTGITTAENTTGALIASQGIVWELDFRNNPALFGTAKSLGSEYAIVKGSLIRLALPNYDYRWVVIADSVSRSKTTQGDPSDASPSVAAYPQVANSSPNPSGSQPGGSNLPPLTMTRPGSSGSPADLANPVQPPIAPNAQQPPFSLAFRSITVKRTAGKRGDEQLQQVLSDGSVERKVPSVNYLDKYNLSQNDLVKLHQFVKKTDWKNVPRSARSSDATSAIRFEISVQTYDGSMRFVLDEASLGKSKVFMEMFSHMKRPK